MDLLPGDKVFDAEGKAYDIIALCNSGGFGLVYELRSVTGDKFALKTIITASLDG